LTDRRRLLGGIPSNNTDIGPFISHRLAIQDLYDGADWLVARGVKLELAWVKARDKAVGNKMADRAALGR